jgi:cobalt-zinc-cadmium efflux system membrane fusion protein
MSRKNLLVGATAAALLAAVGLGAWWATHRAGEGESEPAAAQGVGSGGVLIVEPARAAQMGIALTAAVAAENVPLARIPAIIQPPANARVAVTATLPGVVTRTLVVEGDTVRQGQPLALISSREVLTMAADLARANARLGVAQSNAARLSLLSQEGVIAGARADEANALAAEARADVSEKSRLLRMVNGRGDTGAYTLTAPIAGRVTRAAIQTGDAVDGSTAPFIIDAADRYEVVGQAPARLVGQIRTGMTVRLLPDITGRIVAVGTTIDPTTRSVTVKAEIPAGPGIVAGRSTSILVSGPAPEGAVTAPESAVVDLDGQSSVFVAAPGGYAPRRVSSAGASDGQAVLLSGVRPGEQVVTRGTSALKALIAGR